MTHFRKLRSSHMLAAAATALGLAFAVPAAAQQCPDWRQNGTTISIDAETAWAPQRYPVQAGGPLNLGMCNTISGAGHVTVAPSFTITYDARSTGYDLDFRIESQCDTVMLINDAGAGWHFNDDEDGTLNARLRLADAPSGIYDVWVGTYGAQTCQATLVLETFPGGAPLGAGTCPDWSLGGAELQLGSGASDRQAVVAGGTVNLSANDCGTGGHGHVAEAPDFTLYYTAQSSAWDLQFAVDGQCDTLLLVNDAVTGWWFNDDYDGLDPQITIQAAESGRYDIWVGTYGNTLCNAQLSVSSYQPGGSTPVK
ncbi:MAG: hypothetical protein JJU15_19085 [Pararhodobacter sp.]|nr:hypothetical protein [Pararhodobacter sp.]